jgi:hypothetical protein
MGYIGNESFHVSQDTFYILLLTIKLMGLANWIKKAQHENPTA